MTDEQVDIDSQSEDHSKLPESDQIKETSPQDALHVLDAALGTLYDEQKRDLRNLPSMKGFLEFTAYHKARENLRAYQAELQRTPKTESLQDSAKQSRFTLIQLHPDEQQTIEEVIKKLLGIDKISEAYTRSYLRDIQYPRPQQFNGGNYYASETRQIATIAEGVNLLIWKNRADERGTFHYGIDLFFDQKAQEQSAHKSLPALQGGLNFKTAYIDISDNAPPVVLVGDHPVIDARREHSLQHPSGNWVDTVEWKKIGGIFTDLREMYDLRVERGSRTQEDARQQINHDMDSAFLNGIRTMDLPVDRAVVLGSIPSHW